MIAAGWVAHIVDEDVPFHALAVSSLRAPAAMTRAEALPHLFRELGLVRTRACAIEVVAGPWSPARGWLRDVLAIRDLRKIYSGQSPGFRSILPPHLRHVKRFLRQVTFHPHILAQAPCLRAVQTAA